MGVTFHPNQSFGLCAQHHRSLAKQPLFPSSWFLESSLKRLDSHWIQSLYFFHNGKFNMWTSHARQIVLSMVHMWSKIESDHGWEDWSLDELWKPNEDKSTITLHGPRLLLQGNLAKGSVLVFCSCVCNWMHTHTHLQTHTQVRGLSSSECSQTVTCDLSSNYSLLWNLLDYDLLQPLCLSWEYSPFIFITNLCIFFLWQR